MLSIAGGFRSIIQQVQNIGTFITPVRLFKMENLAANEMSLFQKVSLFLKAFGRLLRHEPRRLPI